MRIVILGGRDPSDEDTWSGTPRSLIGRLRRAGHDVTAVGPLPPIETPWRRLKARYYRHVPGKDYVTIRDPAAVRARTAEASRLLRAEGAVDAVIALHPADAAYLECPAPLIFIHDATWHQLLDFYPRYARSGLAKETIAGGYALDKRALENCDAAIYSSQWSAQSAISGYGASAGKVAVHPFGANLASVPDGNELRDAMGRRGVGRCRLLFVGVDEYRKGADVAVAVARQLRARGVEVDLQIVGCDVPGEDHDLVRRYGFLSRKDAMQGTRLAQLFLQADFFLLPARADCTPIVLSEAAASGLPVATTKVGGIGEIVRAGTWGIALAPEASPADYADWIKQTYSDRGAYERMAKAARLDYEERLNWDSFCRRLTAIVDEIRRAAPREAGQREPVEAAHKVAAATV